jgi:TRAP-type C4-dicarboxylate transport system permease small subunit
MSLRVFHVVFIIVCVAFSLFMAIWGVTEYRNAQTSTTLAVGIIFGFATVALLVYGVKAFKKLKDIP